MLASGKGKKSDETVARSHPSFSEVVVDLRLIKSSVLLQTPQMPLRKMLSVAKQHNKEMGLNQSMLKNSPDS